MCVLPNIINTHMKTQKLLKQLDIAFDDAVQGRNQFLKEMRTFRKLLGKKRFKKVIIQYKKQTA